MTEPRLAAVVGAGPSGLLMSAYLAEVGYRVQVYDKRPETVEQEANRTYHVVIGPRGCKAVETAGLELQSLRCIITEGKQEFSVLSINSSGRQVRHAKQPGETHIMAYRNALAKHLRNQVTTEGKGMVTVHHEHHLEAVDLKAGCATFRTKNGPTKVYYHLLIGADGAYSRTREAMVHQVPAFRFNTDLCSAWYRGMTAPPEICDQLAIKDGTYFNTYAMKGTGNVMTTCPGNGTLDMIIGIHRRDAFAGCKTPEDVYPKMGTGVPLPLRQMVADAILEDKFEMLPSWITCSQLHGPKVALIGDAAHSVVPVLGQGCNSALEDCLVLSNALKAHPGDLAAALEAYNRTRLPDVHALVRITQLVGSGRGVKVAHGAWSLPFQKVALLLHLILRAPLHSLLPSLAGPPAFTEMMQGHISYGKALDAVTRDGLAVGVSILAVAIWAVLRRL